MLSNFESTSTEKTGSLAGHLLIATPVVQGSCFSRSVIYVCAHNEEGAMGVIVNYPVENIHLSDILEQLDIDGKSGQCDLPVHFGGPVEPNRGFVIHDSAYQTQDSLIRQDGLAVSSNITVLQDLASGKGPHQGLLMLGYAGWASGQLESEIESGSWIVGSATRQLMFDTANDLKWNMALNATGIDLGHFSTIVGHA